MKTQWQNIWST